MTDSKLYSALAHWWPLLSPPHEYAEEAEMYRQLLFPPGEPPPASLLELGCGGGHNAVHLKRHFADVVLSDVSGAMLAQSRRLNPDCGHVEGDMRSLRLGRTFDRVFVHDAIDYMTSEADLRAALATAFVHCREGGLALFCPDHLREHFVPATAHGGSDGAGRAMRFLEWCWDPDPDDSTIVVDYVYVLRDGDGRVTVEHDRHVCGLFARPVWLRLLAEVGFEGVRELPFEHPEVAPGSAMRYLARRPLP